MKNLKVFLKLFFSGFILASILSLLTHCPESNPVIPVDDTAVETPALKQLSDEVINAFESGSKDAVLNLLYDDYKFIYEDFDATSEQMQRFAEAINKRKIIFANELYAEYEIIIDQQTYTIVYSNFGDGNWVLQRF
jgi:hypothetical protein